MRRRDRIPLPLMVPPVTLCIALVLVIILTGCGGPGVTNGDVPNGEADPGEEGSIERIPPEARASFDYLVIFVELPTDIAEAAEDDDDGAPADGGN